MRWRLVFTEPVDAARNMAVDEAIVLAHSRGDVPPTLRFYGWLPPAVSVGYSQRVEDQVDIEACTRLGVGWVRRPTGGRAVLHEDEVTYSVVVAQSILPGSVAETYRVLAGGLLEGLQRLGVPAALAGRPERAATGRPLSGACFEAPSWYEITAGDKKIVGSAQTRSCGVLLQHGSVPIVFEPGKIAEVLRLSDDDRLRIRKILAVKAAGISDILGKRPSWSKVAESLAEGFARALDIDFITGGLTPDEEREAGRLAREKYGTSRWNSRER